MHIFFTFFSPKETWRLKRRNYQQDTITGNVKHISSWAFYLTPLKVKCQYETETSSPPAQ